MVLTYDVGSLPFENDYEVFLDESKDFGEYFRRMIVESFIDKVFCGIDVPNYPQYKDMNEMFLEKIDGITKIDNFWVLKENLTVKLGRKEIAEVKALKKSLKEICEKTGLEKVKIKICITGPHTLSWVFVYRDSEIFTQLANVLVRIVESNIFKEKNGEVFLLSVDEPTFGTCDDPQLDYGSAGRESLLKAWEKIFYQASSKNIQTILHLHSTRDPLFWDIKNLKIVESHINDPLYSSKQTKRMLEEKDKFVKASVASTDFDQLIKQKIEKKFSKNENVFQKIGEIWSEIRNGKTDPRIFFEDQKTILERLKKTINLFGVERVLYAGPECGLKSFPTYRCAIEYLKHISNSIK